MKKLTELRDTVLVRTQLAAIVDSSDDAIFSKDLDGIIQTWNRGAQRLYGYTAEEIVGQSVSILMPSDRPYEFESIMSRLKQGERVDHYEAVRMHKDGRRIDVSVSISPLADSTGRLIGAASIARDIGERKRLEEARLAVEARFHTMADHAPVLIWICDTSRNCTWFNRPWLEFTGRTMEAEVGRGWMEGVHPDDLDQCVNTYRASVDAREPFSMDFRLRRADGEYRWVMHRAVPLYEAEDRLAGYIGSCIDITDRKEAAERITRLQSVTSALSEALTRDEVADVVVNQAVGALSAWAGLVGLVEEDNTFRILNSTGYSQGKMERWQSFHLSGPYPVSEAVRTGQPVWVESKEEYQRRFPTITSEIAMETASSAALPLMVKGRPIGAIVLSFAQPQRFCQEDREFIQALSHQCAQALERARLYEVERQAMAEAEEARRRSAFLAEASVILSSSLEYETTLANVARLVVPELADWCVVHLLEEDGSLAPLAVSHSDPGKVAWALEAEKRYPPDLQDEHGVGLVLRTGKPVVYSDVTEKMLARTAQNEEHLNFLLAIGLRSVLMAPLVARGRTLGVLTLIRGNEGNSYTQADQAQAEDLARRCALAVDNARLFQEAQDLNRAKDEFQAMLAHELRNPIGAISNALVLLEGVGAQEPSAVRHRGIASRQLRHVTRLLDDLLDVSRITRGKVRLRSEPVTMGPMVDAVVQTMRAAIEGRGHHLSVTLPREPICVLGDSDRLEQILSNLLDNAAKYTPDGGRLDVRLEREGSHALLSVRDSGIGISKEMLPHIFDLFTQADRSLDRPHGGLGIGLALVKNLVEMHGGSVEARSDGPGRGTEFTVRLPILSIGEPSAMDRAIQSGVDAGHSPAGRRVLLVEDNLDAAETLTEILEMWGHSVRAAPDGPTALRFAVEHKPDVVLLDIGLPGMDGFEVGRRLRALERGSRVLMVALSGYNQPEDRARSKAAGFDEHLPKPIDPATLQSVMARADKVNVPD